MTEIEGYKRLEDEFLETQRWPKFSPASRQPCATRRGMGRAGAPGPSTAQAPKGKGFPCSAGPWRVHCPMHPAWVREKRLRSYWGHSLSCLCTHRQPSPSLALTRSAVAPGALEIGHGPCPSSLGQWSHSSRSDRRAHCPQMAAQGLSQPILQRGGGKEVR